MSAAFSYFSGIEGIQMQSTCLGQLCVAQAPPLTKKKETTLLQTYRFSK